MLCSVRYALDFSWKILDVSQALHSDTLDNKHTWIGFGALENVAERCLSTRSSWKREWSTNQMKESLDFFSGDRDKGKLHFNSHTTLSQFQISEKSECVSV